MITERIVAASCFVSGCLLYWAGNGQDTSAAYLFPNLLALVMAGLGIVMLITAQTDPVTQRNAAVVSVPWGKLWPAFVILLLYMFLAEQVGFFVSSFIAFSALAISYSHRERLVPMMLQCIAIAGVFLILLYALFVLLLKVQIPEGNLL